MAMDDILFGRLGAYLKKRQARKGEQSLSAIDHLVMLERGPIEASSCEELIQKTSSFPRSSERGPIESLAEGCPGELIVGRAAHLFSHVSCSGGTTAVRGDKILRNSHPLEGAVRRRATVLRGGKRPTWSVWPCRRFCRMAERPASAIDGPTGGRACEIVALRRTISRNPAGDGDSGASAARGRRAGGQQRCLVEPRLVPP